MPNNVCEEDFFIYIMQQRNLHFDQTQVHDIVKKIQNLRLQPSAKTDQQHNDYVQQKINHPTCPICHTLMVKRVAKQGNQQGSQFWGCRRFPQCRGTKPFDDKPAEQQISAREMERIISALF